MLRPKTSTEQQRLRSYFQNLNTNHVMVSGEPSFIYNCVSWSVGITSCWLWPGSSLKEFDLFYSQFGYERSLRGPIALWGHDKDTITHVSVLVPQSQPDWESKCGADIRIRHHLNEFKGQIYGRVLAYYSRTINSENKDLLLIENATLHKASIPKDQLQILQKEISLLPKKLVSEFEKLFEDWRNSWFAGRLAINSNPAARTSCYEFFKLLKMGAVILPLIVEKLTERENFFAVQLYERLQLNKDLLVNQNLYSNDFLTGEQGRAAKTISNYLEHKLCSINN